MTTQITQIHNTHNTNNIYDLTHNTPCQYRIETINMIYKHFLVLNAFYKSKTQTHKQNERFDDTKRDAYTHNFS